MLLSHTENMKPRLASLPKWTIGNIWFAVRLAASGGRRTNASMVNFSSSSKPFASSYGTTTPPFTAVPFQRSALPLFVTVPVSWSITRGSACGKELVTIGMFAALAGHVPSVPGLVPVVR